jgi:hypothetical protein
MARPHVHPHAVQAEGVRLLEEAFIAGFRTATDPASFLRLTAVPQALEQGGDRLHLLEVKIVERTIVGAVTPGFGTRQLVYHAYPSALTTAAAAVVLVYCGAEGVRELTWAEVMPTRARTESVGAA